MTRASRSQPRRPPFDGPASDRGAVTVYLVVFTAALIAIAGLVLDAGYTLAARQKAYRQAEQAARAGADALDERSLRTAAPGQPVQINPAAAVAAARRLLAEGGLSGQVTVDGDAVTVTVRTTRRTSILGAVGIGSQTVTGTASATNIRGILTGEPR